MTIINYTSQKNMYTIFTITQLVFSNARLAQTENFSIFSEKILIEEKSLF